MHTRIKAADNRQTKRCLCTVNCPENWFCWGRDGHTKIVSLDNIMLRIIHFVLALRLATRWNMFLWTIITRDQIHDDRMKVGGKCRANDRSELYRFHYEIERQSNTESRFKASWNINNWWNFCCPRLDGWSTAQLSMWAKGNKQLTITEGQSNHRKSDC